MQSNSLWLLSVQKINDFLEQSFLSRWPQESLNLFIVYIELIFKLSFEMSWTLKIIILICILIFKLTKKPINFIRFHNTVVKCVSGGTHPASSSLKFAFFHLADLNKRISLWKLCFAIAIIKLFLRYRVFLHTQYSANID